MPILGRTICTMRLPSVSFIMRVLVSGCSDAVLILTFPTALLAVDRLVRRAGIGALRRKEFSAGGDRRLCPGSATAGGGNPVLLSRSARPSAAGLGDAALRSLFTASGPDLGTARHPASRAQPVLRCAGGAGDHRAVSVAAGGIPGGNGYSA